ncbi:protein of unknown function [Taphrina deformans PYCC 5710]|uniref:3'-5' exonuclease domain-containing protein n=1 Tax=Taphrina deformans (strain PYCC 5710 / ATCC 11124 / CBS 356.35 / IMI 108563 / JCM 9778 / NBRC 8474) TaxID=1097556 RepID=R4XPC6_TAPDE|nr:protein of unknown function [Taphrina deformans PYCC 5710]|eukprot:CCG85090.1 protein of unknown function [Taphrina deformans PYCC 5710]
MTIIDVDAESTQKQPVIAARKRKRLTSTLEAADAGLDDHGGLPVGDSDGGDPSTFEFTHHFKLCSTQGNNLVSIQDEFTLTYTSSLTSLTEWISHLPPSCTLGFDTEGEAQVIQLCCLLTSKLLIFMMPGTALPSYRARCAAALTSVVGSDAYLKVGIAAFEDAIKLRRAMAVESSSIFDLTYLARDLQINRVTGATSRTFQADTRRGTVVISDDDDDDDDCDDSGGHRTRLKSGLKSLFRDLFTAHFSDIQSLPIDSANPYRDPDRPGRREQKWTTYPLRRRDLLYAAKDALFGSLLYNALMIKYSQAEIRQLEQDAARALEARKRRAAMRSRCVDPRARPARLVPHRTRTRQSSCRKGSKQADKTTHEQKKNNKKKNTRKRERHLGRAVQSRTSTTAPPIRIESAFGNRPRVRIQPGRMLQIEHD